MMEMNSLKHVTLAIINIFVVWLCLYDHCMSTAILTQCTSMGKNEQACF